MAFKTVTTMAMDIKKTGDYGPHTGSYVGLSLIDTPYGKQNIWSFVNEDGMPFSIFGFSRLNKAMENIRPGTLCRITYKGTQFRKTKFKPAGQDVHQVLVEVDDEQDEAAPEESPKEAA